MILIENCLTITVLILFNTNWFIRERVVLRISIARINARINRIICGISTFVPENYVEFPHRTVEAENLTYWQRENKQFVSTPNENLDRRDTK